MGKAKTTEQFKKEVYALVGDDYSVLGEYTKNKNKLLMKHNVCNHEYMVTPVTFLSTGRRCPKCFGTPKKTTEQFKKEVYALVGDEYSVLGEYCGTRTKLKMSHNTCGHEYTVTPNKFLLGRRCPKCAQDKRIEFGKSRKKYLDEFEKEFNKLVNTEYTLLSNYTSSIEKIKVKHNKCGHVYEVKANNFLNGQRCPKCMANQRILSKTKSTDEFKKEVYDLVGNEYTVLGEYLLNNLKIEIKHDCGYTYFVKPIAFLQGQRCPKCNNFPGASKLEKAVLTFINSIYTGKIIENYKGISKSEIDIYLPDEKIGIEFDGLHWHSDLFKSKTFHIDKTNLYKEHDIRIIHIFEDEWLAKQDIVKTKLSHILGRSSLERVFARKCNIANLEFKEKNKFLEEYHIQGSDNSSIRLGLFYNTELVAVMTFAKLRRSLGHKISKPTEYELVRYATSKHVIGGFSKLFKHALKNFNIDYVKTYADLRWSSFDSNVYNQNNFKYSHQSLPNYWYILSSRRYHRYSFRKQVLENRFPDIYDSSLTEFEMMDQTKYDRIWDCGNLVYEYKKEGC